MKMEKDKVLDILNNEAACVMRQDTPECARIDAGTCRGCDLVKDTSDVLEAFREAIKAVMAQRTGTWKKVRDPEDRFIPVKYYCSACGKWNGYGMADYCPHCGARVSKPETKEAAEAMAEAVKESHMLDDNESTLAGRWHV